MRSLRWLGGFALAAASLAVACSGTDAPAPTEPTPVASVPEERPVAAAPSISPGTVQNTTTEVQRPAAPQQWEPGQSIVVRGSISKIPWQHLIAPPPGKVVDYLDLEDGGQTVIYVDKTPPCRGLVEVEGVVLELRGRSKRPGGQPGKVDETYSELQIDVARYRCVP